MSCLITSKIGMVALHSQFVLDGKKLCGIMSSILKAMPWDRFCESHPDMRVAHSCLEKVALFASGD